MLHALLERFKKKTKQTVASNFQLFVKETNKSVEIR